MHSDSEDFIKTFDWRRENTIKTYKSLFVYQIEPYINKTLDELLTIWKSKDLAPTTQKTLIHIYKQYIQFTTGTIINTKKYQASISKAQQQKIIKAFTKEETTQLIKQLDKEPVETRLLILFGLHCGLRRGEVMGLDKSDINLENKSVTVNRSYHGPTKSGKSRIIPLSNSIIRGLEEKQHKGSTLFKISNPSRVLHRITKSAGIRELSFHALRHTFATLALENGKSFKQVQKWLGHSSITTTLDTYWHLTKDDQDMSFLPGE